VCSAATELPAIADRLHCVMTTTPARVYPVAQFKRHLPPLREKVAFEGRNGKDDGV